MTYEKETPIIEAVYSDEENGQMPTRKHSDDAGADLHSNEDIVIPAGEWKLVGTGVRIKLPDNTVGYITPRSGLAGKNGLTVLNAPGTVDAGYRGELKVILINHSKKDHKVSIGDRIAQLVVHQIIFPEFETVEDFSDVDQNSVDKMSGSSIRGESGFGSTGA